MITAIPLTGCKKKIADKDGAALRYTYEELEEKAMEGLFTLNADKTFSPLPDGLPGYAETTEEASPERFIWYTDNGQNFTSLIPTVTAATPIVIVYNDDENMPEKGSWYLEKYDPLGATIGSHVMLGEDKTMYISEKDMLKGTSAEAVFTALETKSRDEQHELMEVSGASVKLPIENVETNTNLLLGLTYGKKYTFSYLQGTKTKSVDIIADAYAFQSKEIIQMNAPYKQTDKGYFIINMPMGLENGFYYITDLGFFYYDGSASGSVD